MTQKIQDTNSGVSKGGRLREYWALRGVEQRRSKAVAWDHKDIDIQAILQEYSLKGFEFGRYVNNEDRYDFVLAAKSALHDLSWLLKTQNIGISGEIGIAFGARGRGGHAAAHFEPGRNMINLTKMSGAGTLAHEYGHALDYNIGGLVDQNKRYWALSGGRSMSRWLDDNTGGACRLLMRQLISEIKDTDSFARLKKASDYWHYNTEVFARYFEQWCCYTLRQAHQSNSFLTASWAAYVNHPAYLTEADFKKVLPTGNKLIKNIGLLLNGKKTEDYIPPKKEEPKPKVKKMTVKKEPVKKAATGKTAPKAAPKKFAKKAAAATTAAKASKPSKEKLAYQDYDKAFKALAKFTEKDPIRPSLACVYHNDGDMVATDAHILAMIHDAKYPKAKEGKMVLARKITYEEGKKKITGEPGQILPGKYPNYKAVLPPANKLDKGTTIVIDDELAQAKKHIERERRLKAEEKDPLKYGFKTLQDWKTANPDIDYGFTHIPYQFKKFWVRADLLIRCLNFMKAAGAKTVFYHDNMSPTNRAGIFRSGNLEALIMPVMKN